MPTYTPLMSFQPIIESDGSGGFYVAGYLTVPIDSVPSEEKP